MSYRTCCLLALYLSFAAQVVAAETRYVTDDLQLALYEEQGSKGKRLKRLQSGTRVEVLEESGLYARVKTQDGVVGWTKSGFLINTKPARALLDELKQKAEALSQELKSTQAALKKSRQRMAELDTEKSQVLTELATQKQTCEDNSDDLVRLQQENAAFRERLNTQQTVSQLDIQQYSIPLNWGLIASGIALLLGFIGGISWFDYRSRKRHGGYRIY